MTEVPSIYTTFAVYLAQWNWGGQTAELGPYYTSSVASNVWFQVSFSFVYQQIPGGIDQDVYLLFGGCYSANHTCNYFVDDVQAIIDRDVTGFVGPSSFPSTWLTSNTSPIQTSSSNETTWTSTPTISASPNLPSGGKIGLSSFLFFGGRIYCSSDFVPCHLGGDNCYNSHH